MTADDYYRILGISSSSSIDDIKKAYRQKARMYHPDINPSDDAKDMFISATEAYEFLISNASKFLNDDKAYDQAMEDWRKYRQDRSRHRAKTYARASYVQFRNTKFYRSTRILDGTTIIFGLVISIFMVIFTIFGYYYRLKHPLPGTENPTFLSFIMLLLLSALFFVLSVVFLKVYIETSRKRKKKTV